MFSSQDVGHSAVSVQDAAQQFLMIHLHTAKEKE